jgi:hypothetical protein
LPARAVADAAAALTRDPEKWESVFGKDHAPLKHLDHDPIQFDRIMIERAFTVLQSGFQSRGEILKSGACTYRELIVPLRCEVRVRMRRKHLRALAIRTLELLENREFDELSPRLSCRRVC